MRKLLIQGWLWRRGGSFWHFTGAAEESGVYDSQILKLVEPNYFLRARR